MTLAVYLAAAAAAVIFVAACAWRILSFARAPLHLRWELYPVPHEAPERVAHGGSYFEQGEWWRHPRAANLAGELKFMLPEMLFLRGLRAVNRPLWYRSFPFHFGLYLLAASLALLSGSLVLGRLGGAAVARLFSAPAAVSGAAGTACCLVGAAGLLHRRLTERALKVSTSAGDIFNLSFFIAALALLAVGYAARPAGSPGAAATLAGLLSWDLAVQVPTLFGLGIVAVAALGAYIPLTHMSHFIAKVFTYHAVRWDDRPLLHDERRARAMAEYLTYRPTWSAAHIRSGDPRTWAEVVAHNPSEAPKA